MKYDRLIPINITKSKIESIHVNFGDENKLRWSATVVLLTDKDVRITSIQIGNTAWDEKERAELPLPGIEWANRLSQEVEIAVTRHMNQMQNVLEPVGAL